jgi:hypothetical protein
MEKNTKILLGVAAAGVVAYLVLKPKKSNLIGKQKFSNPNIMGVPIRIKNNFGGLDKACPDGFKYVEYPMIKGFKEHKSDSLGGKCVENSIDIAVEDSSIHYEPRLFI